MCIYIYTYTRIYMHVSKSAKPLWPTGVKDQKCLFLRLPPASSVFSISDSHDYKDPAWGPSAADIEGPIGVKLRLKSINKTAFAIVKLPIILASV